MRIAHVFPSKSLGNFIRNLNDFSLWSAEPRLFVDRRRMSFVYNKTMIT
jgi:hypothetical protein